MSSSLMDLQGELPRSIPLLRHIPNRENFSWREWDPAAVGVAFELPPYLILGELDPASFIRSANGWSARWQGTEDETYFEVSFETGSHWEIRQFWCGLDGGFARYPARIPLNELIGQALYLQFPKNWHDSSKLQLETAYQITVVEAPESAYTFCGIPDGAFRTILFPIAVRNLSFARDWLMGIFGESPPTYPVTVEAKLILQAVNYIEGQAPEWTMQPVTTFNQSLIETGLAPLGFPVRESASASAAWTLRRDVYFLFIGLPFAGLTDMLQRLATENGPIRTAFDPDLRFELRPMVMPSGLEVQMETVAIWDTPRTTRSLMKFSPSHANPADVAPTVPDVIESYRSATATLKSAEAISKEVVSKIEQAFNQETAKRPL